jgi:hypothetical protein
MAIATVAWTLFAFLHEVVGHGGAAILLGETVRGVLTTTVHIEDFYELDHVTGRIGWWGFRTVAAAGTGVNFVTAALALLLLDSGSITQPAVRYFLWLFATISLFQQAFWMAVMPYTELGGDWTAFFVELEPSEAWKIGVTSAGVLLLGTGYFLPSRVWNTSLGVDRGERRRCMRVLTVLPILTAFGVQMLSVIRSPLSGSRHTTIVSLFSFIPLVLWLLLVNSIDKPGIQSDHDRFRLDRSNAWVAAGVAAFLLFVLVLGPGVGSFEGHPDFGD